MRHVNYKLKPATVDNAKPRDKRYDLTDGGGLLLEVMTSGAKVWRYKYHLNGKREKVTIGGYPAFSIKQARDRHEELRSLVERGESPAVAKQERLEEQRVAVARQVDFRAFAAVWISETLFYRSATYRAQIVRWLDTYVYPKIGHKPLGEVLPRDVLEIINPLVGTPTTADRVRVIIQQVYNFAIRKLLVDTNPAAPLRGAIVVPPKTHHPHLEGKQIGHFWRTLAKQRAHATTVFAAQLLLLTMTRKNELLRARWDEFNFDEAVWNVPAERMKMKLPHRVFLSRQALDILRLLVPFTRHAADAYVFPSIYRRDVPMGDVTLNHLFKRMDLGMASFSPHGLRGTGATLLREMGVDGAVVELLLAHSESDPYAHMKLEEGRRRASQLLADEVQRLANGAEIIPLRAA